MIDLSEARRNLMTLGLDVSTAPANPLELFSGWLLLPLQSMASRLCETCSTGVRLTAA